MIPDELIDTYLGTLFGKSQPGQLDHCMVFVTADEADRTALGLPPPDKLKATIFAIAPTEAVDSNRFVAQCIRDAIVDARQRGTVPYFVALAMEVHLVVGDGSEVSENLARRLGADRKLQEHPAAVEATVLYAACRDGRRWVGEHYLTGDRAGTVVGPQIRVGSLGREESGIYQRLIRMAVGLP